MKIAHLSIGLAGFLLAGMYSEIAAADQRLTHESTVTVDTLEIPNSLEVPVEEVVEIESESLPTVSTTVREVPFYSQFDDISRVDRQKTSCGVASLAMLIDYYRSPVLPDQLLAEGLASGAYIHDAGWSHQGLINLAEKHGLSGFTNTMYDMSMNGAMEVLKEELEEGPVMVSVQYTFDPRNPIPHLVVVRAVEGGMVYYSDPADGEGSITIEKFTSSWKKRYIAIRPLE